MILRDEIKSQFDSVAEQLNGQISSLPESTSVLVELLIALSKVLLDSFDSLKQSLENQTQTIEQQTQTIEQQTQKIDELIKANQELADKLAQKNQENQQLQEFIKTLKTLVKSKNVDLDALKRLLFQGGREQKRESKPEEQAEKPQPKKKNSPTRNRQSNSEKFDQCDVKQPRFVDKEGNPLAASTRDEASEEVPQQIEIDGKKYAFKGWKESSSKIKTCTTRIKVTTYVPVYEEVLESLETEKPSASEADEQGLVKTPIARIIGFNPEEDFLKNTVFGYDWMAEQVAFRMTNRIPMNRIAQAVSEACGFRLTRQQLARYFVVASEWINPAYEYLMSCVLDSKIIHLDETFIHCQEEENSCQYMIVFTSERGCFYFYSNTRSQTVPLSILQNHFDGDRWVDNEGNTVVISTDGWYNVEWLMDAEGDVSAVLVGCMVHLRRYFWDVYDVHENHKNTESEDYKISEQIINHLKFIFHRDKEYKTIEERTKARKQGDIREKFEEIKKLVDEYYDKMMECKNPSQEYTAKFIKAIKYAHNQWEKFARIMEDGAIPLDNSDAERAIRDFAVLRHSTASGFGSIKGAKAAAIFSSFHETCKKHGVRLRDYMEFLFEYIGLHRRELNNPDISVEEKNEILEKAMPWNFEKA